MTKDFPPPVRACKTCRYSSLERPNPTLLQEIRMCRYGPLTPVVLPPATIRAMVPPVADADWCYRWELSVDSAIVN